MQPAQLAQPVAPQAESLAFRAEYAHFNACRFEQAPERRREIGGPETVDQQPDFDAPACRARQCTSDSIGGAVVAENVGFEMHAASSAVDRGREGREERVSSLEQYDLIAGQQRCHCLCRIAESAV